MEYIIVAIIIRASRIARAGAGVMAHHPHDVHAESGSRGPLTRHAPGRDRNRWNHPGSSCRKPEHFSAIGYDH